MAKSEEEVVFRQGKRTISLEKWSMTTPIELKPLEGGSPVTKSKEISSHGWEGTWIGISFPTSGFEKPFMREYTWQ